MNAYISLDRIPRFGDPGSYIIKKIGTHYEVEFRWIKTDNGWKPHCTVLKGNSASMEVVEAKLELWRVGRLLFTENFKKEEEK